MKNIFKYYLMAFLMFSGSSISAQEFADQLKQAQSAYKSGNLQDTRFALQQALAEVDRAIGTEILKILPVSIGNMAAQTAEDNVSGSGSGFAGLFVNRNFKGSDNLSGSIQIIGDSPMLAGINAILALPTFVTDPNQKKIKVGSYRALLQKSINDIGIITWNLQIPFGNSLFTLHCEGVNEEKVVVDMANTISFDKISRFLQ